MNLRLQTVEADAPAQPPGYVVGIDLGTTNCALAFVDTTVESWQLSTFLTPQWVDLGQWERRETLPSFHYQWTDTERAGKPQLLPWQTGATPRACVGALARDAGLRAPGRRAGSAKSWLCHDAVDRTADLLPWHGDADVDRLSPVDASAAYLEHLRCAWDHQHPDAPLADQDVVITLPASFDEVARQLTIRAAKQAGLPRVYLIEEPQAAFYAWIDRHRDQWQQQVAAGQLILVCDIGGGTTDLTLIRVQNADDDQIQFHRVAVGKHLILGGDNLDLAIAKHAESKWLQQNAGSNLSPEQWERLVQASRLAKETMLGDNPPPEHTIHLPAEGSQLLGGGIQISVTDREINQVLLDGFFPVVPLTAVPESGSSGFQEFGLPYAADPAITRHLAQFLSDHRRSGLDQDDAAASDVPQYVLFNGGVLAAPAIRQRLVQVLQGWFAPSQPAGWQIEVLDHDRLDLAVARGAAYYGMVRLGAGVRILANLGRTYYLQVAQSPPTGLCLIPGNAQPGHSFTAAEHPLRLQIGSPVQFPLWYSSTRLADAAGSLVTLDVNEATPLPPICTALMRGKSRQEARLDINLEAELSEIGTLGLYCVDVHAGKRWNLEFDIRSTVETDRTAHTGQGEAIGIIDDQTSQRCQERLRSVFGPRADQPPNRLVKALQRDLELSRTQWPPALLRQLWQTLLDHRDGRKQTPQHEARWLNLLGYCLRPGYGVAVDDWRVAQTWREIYGKLAFPTVSSRLESVILWRRIAGGLTTTQQQQLAAPLVGMLQGRAQRMEANEANELWRLMGSLERLPLATKINLARLGLRQLRQIKHHKTHEAIIWALGRLGSRQPLYGPLNTALPTEEVRNWLPELLARDAEKTSALSLTLVQLARRTGDRFRDLPSDERVKVQRWLLDTGSKPSYLQLLDSGGSLDQEDQNAVFGESLPLGIRLTP